MATAHPRHARGAELHRPLRHALPYAWSFAVSYALPCAATPTSPGALPIPVRAQ